MATQATDKSIKQFLDDYYKIGRTYFDYEIGRDGIEIIYKPKNTVSKNQFIKDFNKLINDNFSGVTILDRGKVNQKYKLLLHIKGGSGFVGGVIPTAIQEKGTTFVFNQVLKNNKKFETDSDILDDDETRKGLEKIFGSTYKNRLVEWTHSYFEQQKEFLKEYSGVDWDEFEYGGQDFVKFFSKQIKNVVETPEPIKPVGDYTTWNPSDIWAVRGKVKVQREIEKNLNPKTQSLTELNVLLIEMFKEKRLVGLSLKKVSSNKSAKLKFVNIDTSTMKLAEIEDFKMSDIKFDLHNLFSGDSNTTYIHFDNKRYSIYVTKVGGSSTKGNLGFSTQIKNSAAQGGQVPVRLLEEAIKKRNSQTTFVNDHKNYPQTPEEFLNDRKRKYEIYFNEVIKFDKTNISYNKFEDSILELYREGKSNIAISKLMQLNFYYDSLKSGKLDSEYWTDLLYLGLKIGERFAPHAKIS
jgi:hypothetical protein